VQIAPFDNALSARLFLSKWRPCVGVFMVGVGEQHTQLARWPVRSSEVPQLLPPSIAAAQQCCPACIYYEVRQLRNLRWVQHAQGHAATSQMTRCGT
jgi:hypothetical protein